MAIFGQSKRFEKKLAERGACASAEVLEAQQTSISLSSGNSSIVQNTSIVWKLRLLVKPEDGDEFNVAIREKFSQLRSPSVGQALLVVYDPNDHSKVAVDHDAMTAASATADAEMSARLDAINARLDAASTEQQSAQVDAPTPSAAMVLATGVAVRVVLLQAQPMGQQTAAGLDIYALTLTVLHDGGAPTQTTVGNPVPPDCARRLYPGSNLPAKMLATNTNAIVIDWDVARNE